MVRRASGPRSGRSPSGHLLTHTSGFTYANWSAVLQRFETVTGLRDTTSLQNKAFDAPLEFDPGDRWEYGISMYWVGRSSRR